MNLLLRINVLLIFSIHLLFSYDADVTRQIQEIINKYPEWHIGCQINSVNTGECIYAYDARHLFTPASNTKLFTGALALETLGSDYQFKTQLLSDGANLYLKSAGDPSLTSAALEAMIETLVDKRITAIENFYIDDLEFDHDLLPEGSFLDNIGYSWNGLVSGLMIDRKAVIMGPASPTLFLHDEQNAKLADIFCDGQTFITSLLEKQNIQITGTVLLGKTSDHAIVVAEHAMPFVLLLNRMLKESDNIYADYFFKKIGAVVKGIPGTWQKGMDVLIDFLQSKLAINLDEIMIKDGAGRSRYNLISPEHIVTLLCWVNQQPYRDVFMHSLPISGVDGTLKNRMTDIAGKVKAKTGLLAGVSSLSGYIEGDNDMLVFSILTNGFIAKSLYAPECRPLVEDAICRLLVQ